MRLPVAIATALAAVVLGAVATPAAASLRARGGGGPVVDPEGVSGGHDAFGRFVPDELRIASPWAEEAVTSPP